MKGHNLFDEIHFNIEDCSAVNVEKQPYSIYVASRCLLPWGGLNMFVLLVYEAIHATLEEYLLGTTQDEGIFSEMFSMLVAEKLLQ